MNRQWIRHTVAICGLSMGLGLLSCKRQQATDGTIEITLLHTTDVHGNVFPYDYINQKPGSGSLARFASYLEQMRSKSPNLILLDAGDILQGEPITYYYDYVDTTSSHAIVDMMNYLGYDAMAVGNHDIEPGHRVYDRFVHDAHFPVLGANVLSSKTHEPYFKPYTTFEKEGAKIAVLGMLTPAIPQWLPAHLWEGMEFEDIITSCQKWVPKIQQTEKPDILVVLMHSGLHNHNQDYLEDAADSLAHTVAGIDIILMGHDHRQNLEWVKRSPSDSVLLINPANHADFASQVDISLKRQGGQITEKRIKAQLIDLNAYEPSDTFLKKFATANDSVHAFLDKPVGTLTAPVKASDALFGSSGYMGVIHNMQLHTAQAEISFAAPLAINAELAAGEVYVRDLFKFCPYSNYLYTMELTGKEILGYLEHSYAGWTTQMSKDGDHLLRFRTDAQPSDKYKTEVPTYNYSSAQGIDYTVDVSQPQGHKVHILQMSDGQPFSLTRKYHVAINSYRAGGAGGLLTTGAGIAKEDLPARIVAASQHDQFYSLMQYFQLKKTINPVNPRNWEFLPKAWITPAMQRDSLFLFTNH